MMVGFINQDFASKILLADSNVKKKQPINFYFK